MRCPVPFAPVSSTIAAIILASITLASCGRHERPVAASRPAPLKGAASAAAAPASLTSGTAAVWNLRAGLNVAALSCRGSGRRPVAGDYARLLTRHRGLLDAAYRTEQGRQGVSAFDRQQTRVYNGFANQASPARFCMTASAVAQRANGLDSPALALAAPKMLGELRAALRYRP